MIISNIIGGLGNQMFQYAAGRALALSLNTELYLDIGGFDSYRLHNGFQLSHVFSLPARISGHSDTRKLLGWQASKIRILSHPKFAWLRKRALVVEPYFDFWAGFFDAPSDCYISGYWQSEKYFAKHADRIREEFSFHLQLDDRNAEIVRRMKGSNSVSLHIRRGDYVNNPKTLAVHGLCDIDYYQAAVELVSARVVSPSFFVFSDDIAWARENLKMVFPCEFIGHNQGEDSYKDMQLMSVCSHHIIANSSFSWWGAWLNPEPQKIVIAPKKWFADGRKVPDLLPESWVCLP